MISSIFSYFPVFRNAIQREELPIFGHNSQVGSSTPTLQGSQKQGYVEHDEIVDDELAVS